MPHALHRDLSQRSDELEKSFDYQYRENFICSFDSRHFQRDYSRFGVKSDYHLSRTSGFSQTYSIHDLRMPPEKWCASGENPARQSRKTRTFDILPDLITLAPRTSPLGAVLSP